MESGFLCSIQIAAEKVKAKKQFSWEDCFFVRRWISLFKMEAKCLCDYAIVKSNGSENQMMLGYS